MVDLAKKVFLSEQLVYFDAHNAGFQAAKNKEVFAYFTDEIFIDDYITSNPNDSIYLKVLLFKEMFDHLAIGIPPGKRHLQYWLNVVLDGEKKITVADMFEKYRRIVIESKKK